MAFSVCGIFWTKTESRVSLLTSSQEALIGEKVHSPLARGCVGVDGCKDFENAFFLDYKFS